MQGALAGTVDGAAPIGGVIQPLARQEYTTGVVGRIDPRLRPGDRTDITLTVNGVAAAPFATEVRRALLLTQPLSTVDAPAGTARVSVMARNISTGPTQAEGIAILTIGGREVRAPVRTLPSGETHSLAFDVSELDPLALMTTGLRGALQLRIGDIVMDEQVVRLASASARADLVRYYALLAAAVSDGAHLPPSVPRAERLATVRERIATMNRTEVRGARGNPWKDSPQTTVVGMVRSALQSTPADAAARAEVAVLAAELWDARKELGRFLFFSSAKRKAYEAIVRDVRSLAPR
jgi:hypothetical protein